MPSAASTTAPTTGWADDQRYYTDFTGCGNTLDLRNPRVLQLVIDSLRYWVTEMHVDGFRFDLARRSRASSPTSTVRAVLRGRCARTRCSSRVKLIAEPWDLGDGGYQVGDFPPGWAEWNDQYRDTMRAYWKGDGGLIGEFARRLTGSQRPLRHERPRPVRERQLRHRARRLHAATTWCRTTRSTTRPTARTTATAPTTTSRGTAAPRARPTTRRSARCASGRSATSSPRCCSRRACRCCIAGDEVGRTQQRQQQRLLPGQRDQLASTGTATTARWRLLDFTTR